MVVLIASRSTSTAPLEAPSITTPASSAKRTPSPRERWDGVYTDLEDKRWHPNALLVDVVREREPGRALDVGAGQGRNALHLAERGWQVTAIDISGVGIGLLRSQARTRGLEIDAHRTDARKFEFGIERWDLVVCSYMHTICVAVAAEMVASLAPGGLLVIEGFVRGDEVAAVAHPRLGFEPGVLPEVFSSLEVLRYEQLSARGDWYDTHELPIVRFVGRKPGADE